MSPTVKKMSPANYNNKSSSYNVTYKGLQRIGHLPLVDCTTACWVNWIQHSIKDIFLCFEAPSHTLEGAQSESDQTSIFGGPSVKIQEAAAAIMLSSSQAKRLTCKAATNGESPSPKRQHNDKDAEGLGLSSLMSHYTRALRVFHGSRGRMTIEHR